MSLQVKNAARLTDAQKAEITERAAAIRRGDVGRAPADSSPSQPGSSLPFTLMPY